MNKTGIEYLDFTWSPIAMRCTPCSSGCANCWHIKTADRLSMNISSFPLKIREAYAGERGPVLVEERLNDPIKRKKPARIGVQFMGDLFHKDVPFGSIDHVFSAFNYCPHHTFIVLTKRPERMLEWYNQADILGWGGGDYNSNTWLGVSVCNDDELHKIETLLRIPAVVRFVSVEPMLSEIKMPWGSFKNCMFCCWKDTADEPCDHYYRKDCPHCGGTSRGPHIDWVICGGESGPGARPMHPDWARDLKFQCKSAGVPFFFKQMSKKQPIPDDLIIREYPK